MIFEYIVSLVTILLATLSFISLNKKTKNIDFEKDYNKIFREIKELKKEHKSEVEDREYALMVQYHSQGLSQSKISFWFSLIFAALGFGIIVSGLSNISNYSENLYKPLISIMSGTVIDAIAALFFVQSNKARQLMITFFDKLRADRKIEDALLLSDEIPDIEIKSKLKSILALSFADIKTDYHILTQYLQNGKKEMEANIMQTRPVDDVRKN